MAANLPPGRRHGGLPWVLLYGCLPVLLLYASTRADATPWSVERLSVPLVGRAQSVRQSMFDGVGRIWRQYVALVDLAGQLARLGEENGRLRLENQRFAALAAENARLRELLGFSQRFRRRHQLVPARVVARDTSPFFRVVRLRIDTARESVRPGQPVVSADGVIGQVDRVTGDYADVMLLADARSAVDVVVQTHRAMGILKGLGSSEHYRCKIEYLRRTEEVAEGDLVVTSGMDERFPKDLAIGRVSEVARKQYGLYQQVIVEPSVDFARISEAYVIVDETAPAEGVKGPIGPGPFDPAGATHDDDLLP